MPKIQIHMKKGLLGILLLWNMVVLGVENKTKLVVGITISNFYPEWLMIYQNDLCEGGFKRLTSQGGN